MELIIISLLILINGFFALSEIALVSSKKSRIEQLINEKKAGAKTALKLLKDSENFLSAIQVGITLIGIITGVYGGINIADDFAPLLEKIPWLEKSAGEIALTITVIIITYFSIVLGELVPKTIALSNPEKIAIRIAPPIYFFSVLFYPVVSFLSYSTSIINRLIGVKAKSEHITEAELRLMIKMASRDGVIENDQNLIHERAFYFSDKKARHIMTHRLDLEWIDLNQSPAAVREAVLKSKYSRLLCCRENLDNFEGILSVREFLSAGTIKDEGEIRELLIQPLFVPESADAHKVLEMLRKEQNHFCIVVDEYGSIEGIITPHDILENLIGEIPEEGESFEPDIFVREDKSYLVSGDAPVELLEGIFENYLIDFENIEYSTVAGFVLNNIDKIPQIGDSFTFNNYIIEIVDIDGRRVDKVLIRKKE